MDEYVITLLFVAVLVAYCSWRERINDNRRDSRILAGIAAAGVATAGLMVAA
jgi:hypothetical protein